jgi:NADH dehydrogenase (ubiquinone) 1 beta subcomplex subunit 6
MPKNPPTNIYPGAYPIAGRMASERERLVGMTDAERAWRAQWLKDQHLAPNEPRVVPELIKEHTNAIRRIYRFPLDTLFRALAPALVKTTNNTDYI